MRLTYGNGAENSPKNSLTFIMEVDIDTSLVSIGLVQNIDLIIMVS